MAAADDIVVKLRMEQDGSVTPTLDRTTAAIGKVGDAAKKADTDMRGMASSFAVGQMAANALQNALDSAARATLGQFKAALDTADQIYKLSQQTGIAVRELSAFRYIADLSGASIESFAVGMRFLNTAIVQGSDVLRTLGISTRDTNTALLQISDVFAALPDSAEKSRLAVELFGRSGTQLIPMLNGGADAMAALRAEADQLGVTFDEQTAKKAEIFNDEITKLGYSLKALAYEAIPAITSSLTPLINAFTGLISGALSFNQAMDKAFSVGWDKLGTPQDAFVGPPAPTPSTLRDPAQSRQLQQRLASVFARSDAAARGGSARGAAASTSGTSDPYAAQIQDERALESAIRTRYETSRSAAQAELENLQASGAAVDQLIAAQERLNSIERERLQRQIAGIEDRMGPFLPGQQELNAAEVEKLRQEILLLPDATKKWQRATEEVRGEIDMISGAISGSISDAVRALISGGGGFSLGDIAKSAGQIIAANLTQSFIDTLLGAEGIITGAIKQVFSGGGLGDLMTFFTGGGGGASSLASIVAPGPGITSGGALAGLGQAAAIGIPLLAASGIYQAITKGDPRVLQASGGLAAGATLSAPSAGLGFAGAGFGGITTLVGAGMGIGRAFDTSQGSVLSYDAMSGSLGGAAGALSGFGLGNAMLPGIGGIVGTVLGGLIGLISGLFRRPSFEEKWGEYMEREFDRVGLKRGMSNWGIGSPDKGRGLQRDPLAYREGTPENRELMGLFGDASILGRILYGMDRRKSGGFANLFLGNEMDLGNTNEKAMQNLQYYARKSGVTLLSALETINESSLAGEYDEDVWRRRGSDYYDELSEFQRPGSSRRKRRRRWRAAATDRINELANINTEADLLAVLDSPVFRDESLRGINVGAIGRESINHDKDLQNLTIDIEKFKDEIEKAAAMVETLGSSIRTGVAEFVVALSEGAKDATERLASTFMAGVRDVLLDRVGQLVWDGIVGGMPMQNLIEYMRLGSASGFSQGAIELNSMAVLGQAITASRQFGDMLAPIIGALSYESLGEARDAVGDRQFAYRLQDANPRRRRSMLRGRVSDVQGRIDALLNDDIDDGSQVSQLARLYNELGQYADSLDQVGDRRGRDSVLSQQAAGLDRLAEIQEKRADAAEALWKRIAEGIEEMVAAGATKEQANVWIMNGPLNSDSAAFNMDWGPIIQRFFDSPQFRALFPNGLRQ